MTKKVFTIFIFIHIISYSIGQEILNFYIDRNKKGLYQNYIEYENKSKKLEYIKWKIGEGSIEINKEWNFEYSVEKKFENISHTKNWENIFSLSKTFKEKNYFGKTWYTNLGPYIKYDITKISNEKSLKENKYGIRYRIRTNSDVGLGNAYWGMDFITSYMDTNVKDGILIEANLTGSASFGYGFQNFLTIYNEYLNYERHNGAYLLRIENTFRWTYDFSENFAFSFENEIDSYNYFGNTNQKSSMKFTIGPYLLFNKNLTEKFRIFSKIGILGFNYQDYRSNNYKEYEKGSYVKIKVGFEYIF